MAVFTQIGRIDMTTPLTRCNGAIMTVRATTHTGYHFGMINLIDW